MNTYIFDRNSDLFYRAELSARYDYLIETATAIEPSSDNVQAWLDTHSEECATLQHLLYKTPQTYTTTTELISERYVLKCCKELVKTHLRKANTLIDNVETIAEDMTQVEINGQAFYMFNYSDLS